MLTAAAFEKFAPTGRHYWGRTWHTLMHCNAARA